MKFIESWCRRMNRLTKKVGDNYCSQNGDFYDLYNKLGKLEDLGEELGCPLEVLVKALNGFYIDGYGYVSNNDDFIYLRKVDNSYYLKVVIHPSKPTPPDFYGFCDIHFLKSYKNFEADLLQKMPLFWFLFAILHYLKYHMHNQELIYIKILVF